MRIGILGSGLMGGKLGTLFARIGHQVVFSYARTGEKLEKLARDAGKNASAGTPAQAAQDADAVLLAVHWSRMGDVLKQAGSLKGKIVIDCSLPMNASDTELVVGLKSSGAEKLAQRIRGASIVSAFGTIPSEVLFDVYERRRNRTRPDLVFCSDDESAKKTVGGLIRDLGFNPIDVGGLRMARYLEPFTLLIAKLAYEVKGGPELAYRFERMG